MKAIIHGIRYDTKTATEIISREWSTYHPNLSGGEPTLEHQRGVYRGKNGGLFGHIYDERGYGRDPHTGATGAFVKEDAAIIPFESEAAALIWAEEEGFDADDLETAFGDQIEDA
ncbi:MAG: hypothetical protein ABW003_12970 [Microvirga sp.]